MKKIVLIILVVISGCSKEQMDDCFTSLGEVTTIERVVDPFKRVMVHDRMQVELIQDGSKHGAIEIEGPENILTQIKTDVSDQKLEITNTNTCNFVRSFKYEIKLRVYVDTITELSTQSIGVFTTQGTLKGDRIDIYHSALSDIELDLDYDWVYIRSINSAHTRLTGTSRVLTGTIEEVSDLDAQDLNAELVFLDTHTPLDCFVTGTKILFVKIFNSGNIFYTVEPTDQKEVNIHRGSGDLLPIQ